MLTSVPILARVARHVTGIDLTPAMLEQARALQRQQGLENLTWQEGDVLPLPYADHSFSIVSTRFAFHHFEDPLAVLKEMRRVCRPGGRVVVADSAPAAGKADAFNRMERLRDPSHVRALSPEELRALFTEAGLPAPRVQPDLLPGDITGNPVLQDLDGRRTFVFQPGPFSLIWYWPTKKPRSLSCVRRVTGRERTSIRGPSMATVPEA